MSKQYASAYAFFAVIALIGAAVQAALSGRLTTDQIVVAVVVAVVLPPVLIWVLRKMGYPVGQPVSCPRCRTEMPLFRKPASLNQALRGGYHCPGCGTQLDARGRELTPDSAR